MPRAAKLRVFYAMHHRYRAGDYETWTYIAPIQRGSWQHKSFEYGTWGGEFRAQFVPAPGEIVAQEHWCSSGFANTDLDLQLKKASISSSSSDSSRIPASKRLCAMPPSSVMRSPSLEMRRRTTQTR